MSRRRVVSRGAATATAGLVLSLLPTGVPDALAGGKLPCGKARLFSAAAVNALVLPYRYSGGSHDDVTSTGSRLAALVQQETLFALLKYGSVGVTELVADDGVCDVRRVLRLVKSRSGDGGLRRGHGLVILWGRIYEEGQDLYVQSYIRFLRGGEAETIQVDLSGAGATPLRLQASLPPQAAAMPPRALTKKDILEIETRARDILVMRPTPDDRVKGRPLSRSPSEPLTYGVEKASGEWMRIRSFVTGEKGWVRARTDNESWALRRFLPELGYLDGVAGYLRLRASSTVPLTNPTRVRLWMEEAFASFEATVGADASPEASGLARAMRGVELWGRPAPSADERGEAARLCREAFEKMPDSPDVRVLATVTASWSGHPIDKTVADQLNRGLMGALAVDPHNVPALRNLERLYGFASQHDLGLYDSEALRSRLALVKAARESAERP